MIQTIRAYLPLVAGRQPDRKRPLPLKSQNNLVDFRAIYQKTTVRIFYLLITSSVQLAILFIRTYQLLAVVLLSD